MAEITLTLPDGKKLEIEKGATCLDAAKKIGAGLARAVVAAKLDDTVVDLSRPIEKGANFVLFKPDSPEGLGVVRHSTAHVMAQAILRLYPDCKLTIGPVVDNGYYYDIERQKPFQPDELEKIEAEMARVSAEDQPFERVEVSKNQALDLYSDNVFKREIIAKLPTDAVVSVYYNRKTSESPADAPEFYDLCSGPHVPSTSFVKAFKLLKVAGAYWRADAQNEQLQRVYGTAFADKKELAAYLQRLEEAGKRDHRKVGRELDLVMFHEYAPGMPFLLPNGAIVRKELENFIFEEQKKRGYQDVRSPIIMNSKLWHTSGHWDHYKDNIYFTEIDGQQYGVKPMNCPGHMLMFANSTRSYRDLPIRLSEFGMVHRHELSGVLAGMFRVRAFTQDDTHIFCTFEQIEDEVMGVIELTDFILKTFGFEYSAELSTRPEQFMGERKTWDEAEAALESAIKKTGISYEINAGDGAFYGPKIDFKVRDAIGRIWQLSTCQLDFQMPMRFGLKYEGADGQQHAPVVIHRAIYGSLERFMGILIEHYAGKFPVWLSPVQIAILPINDGMVSFAKEMAERFKAHGFRAFVNEKTETINAKIRDAQMQKIPYMLVVGQKEAGGSDLQVRQRDGKQFSMSADEFISHVQKMVGGKKNIE
ncbi:MAG: threonine--tRNA ligase [Candidatus Micrarchaeota archaeon]